MQKTLPSLMSMSTAVRVTAMTLLYVILLVRCEDEHAFELVVASVRIPDLRSRTGASGIGRRSFERCGAKNIRTGKENSWVPANQA